MRVSAFVQVGREAARVLFFGGQGIVVAAWLP